MELSVLGGFHVRHERWPEATDLRIEGNPLFLSALFGSAPHHSGLFL